MPLTIRELHVKMVVEENDGKRASLADDSANIGGISEDRLIDKCVETVLQILEDKNEK